MVKNIVGGARHGKVLLGTRLSKPRSAVGGPRDRLVRRGGTGRSVLEAHSNRIGRPYQICHEMLYKRMFSERKRVPKKYLERKFFNWSRSSAG